MIFSASPWWFPAIVLPGLGLTYFLYVRARLPAPAPMRRLLALLSGLAWILLGVFAVGPSWKLNPEVYHPPVVVLAVDESASYAVLGARAAAQAGLDSARRHYEARGFRVLAVRFTEDAKGLRRHLDSLAPRNLQAILLWSDGRPLREEQAGHWPAPVHPVRVTPKGREGGGEVQGERAALTLGKRGADAEGELTWRGAQEGAGDAVAEIRAAGKTVWTQRLARPEGSEGTTQGAEVTTRFRVPAGRIGAHVKTPAEAWTLLVRPEKPGANAIARNDTVALRIRGMAGAREVFLRPLASLEERGLVDALSAGDSVEVVAVFPREAALSGDDLLWVRAGRGGSASESARTGSAPRIEYHLPDDSSRGGTFAAFGPEARLVWREDGKDFLPAAALRLADLGAGQMRLRAPDSGVEALAWAEQDGRRGLLLWRSRAPSGAGRYGFAAPPLWRAGFQPGAAGTDAAAREMRARWVRGTAAWVRAAGRVRVTFPEVLVAGRPFDLIARLPEALADSGEYALTVDSEASTGTSSKARARAGVVRFAAPALEPGLRNAALRRGPRTLWTGRLRVRAPRDFELSRLGNDLEALEGLAASTGGSVLNIQSVPNSSKTSWPGLAGGQMRETRFRAVTLAPPLAASLCIALLLCALWALRKRLQID